MSSPGVDPPQGVRAAAVWRVSETVPAPVLDERGLPAGWAPTSVTRERVGVLQIVVEGVDVTYWGGLCCPVPTWSRSEPFGPRSAQVVIPGVLPFVALPAWVLEGARVVIRLIGDDGGREPLFVGAVSSWSPATDVSDFELSCVGVLLVADKTLRRPALTSTTADMGHLIASALTDNLNRGSRYKAMVPVTTGLVSAVSGAWQPTVTGFVQDLLATMLTASGRQWTVACQEDTPVLVLKDRATVAWTVRAGQRGVDLDLDHLTPTNAIYGQGTDARTGGRWRGAVFPGWHPDDAPAYPFTNPARTIRVGTTDAQTDSGTGVSLWQARVGQPVTGRFTAADRAVLRRVQSGAGIQVDGSLGPQSWAATFEVGANAGSLDAEILPLAVASEVEPHRRGARGQILGANPRYDPSILRVEEFVNFGQGVTLAEGKRTAAALLHRDLGPGWVGTITLEVDPREGSRLRMREGQNLRVLGLHGAPAVVHISGVTHAEASTRLEVDTHARDLPTLAAVRERERGAQDAAKTASARKVASAITADRPAFDAESPAGTVPDVALFAGLWTVIPVPFGSYGTITRTELSTHGPAAPFAVSVWDRPVTAARLLDLVGRPLLAQKNPWSKDGLDEAGLLMSWGWRTQPAGYYPGSFSDTEGETSDPVTGRLVDDAAWTYASTRPPWLWVAFIASQATRISGRFWPGADW